MLVLSRRVGESLTIGQTVTVKVLKVSGNRATLGINCPFHVKVLRAEIKDDGRAETDEERESDVEEIADDGKGMRIIWRWFLPNRKKCLPHHPPVFVNSSPPIHPPVVCHLSVSADVKALP